MLPTLILAALPLHPDPQAPFPHVLASPSTITRITEGVTYGTYDLTTSLGPIVVHVLDVTASHPDVYLDTVLSHDALTSAGETISSMAQRTDAIAGLNGDYFDIGATNQPTNIVVRTGALLRTPRKRFALFLSNDGNARIDEVSFSGEVQIGDRTFPLDAINEMLPPHGGISLLTPQYGPVAANPSVTLLALRPSAGTPPFVTYTAGTQLDGTSRAPAGYYLAIGSNAIDRIAFPNPGDTIVATGDLDPVSLSATRAAIGGGPLILADGQWYDDLDGPRGGSYDMRAPQSGAALTPDGDLLLFEVDGRQPELSVGVTPHEFSALMRAFGATRGMEFDSGGSAEMSVRIPGDASASLVNSPSDGKERPVSDGIFVYSTAPVGVANALVAQPQTIRAMPGARVHLDLRAVDAAYHPVTSPAAMRVHVEPADLGSYRDGVFVADHAGNGALVARSGALVTRVPVEVVSDPARVTIVPAHPAVAQGGSVDLDARAFDASGYSLAVPAELPWRATSGTIASSGRFSAGTSDALVSLLLGNHLSNTRIAVGFRDVPLPFANGARFMTSPKGGDGAVDAGNCASCIDLRYELGPQERAAYAVSEIALPPHSAGIAFDVLDDGSEAHLKVALHNAINEEVLLPATTLTGHGWRHIVVNFPQSLAQPARLTAIYVIGAAPGEARSGRIEIKDVKAVVAGSE